MDKKYAYRWWEKPEYLFRKAFPFVDLDWLFAQESLRRMRGDYSNMKRARNRLGLHVYFKPSKTFSRRCVGPEGRPIVSIAWFEDNEYPPLFGGRNLSKDTREAAQ